MSLASIRAKELKGKKKVLPKLKTILANPYKSKWLTLSETELNDLGDLLNEAIDKSGLTRKAFSTEKHICIGLDSVLRTINNDRASCVFLSLSIKPRHVVNLVARNAEVKNAIAPVYALPNLEEFTTKMFGVRALAFCLPVDIDKAHKINEWVGTRNRPLKEKQRINVVLEKPRKLRKPIHKVSTMKNINKADNKAEQIGETTKMQNQNSWSGDFISFSSSTHSIKMDKLQLEEDKYQLLGALNQMTEQVQATSAGPLNKDSRNMDIDESEARGNTSSFASDSDDFLHNYQGLKVHRICPKEDRKTKKKRKNKKKV